jgi:hypothetical protein
MVLTPFVSEKDLESLSIIANVSGFHWLLSDAEACIGKNYAVSTSARFLV